MSREKLLAPFLSSLLRNSNVGSQGGARREYPGDARDDVRIATLRKMVESRVDPPAFVTKPMGQWTDVDRKEAAEDPSGALDILRAIQKKAENVSDELLGMVWVFSQEGVFPEFTMLTSLDESGMLTYAKPRGGKTLAECVTTILPPGFLDADAFAPGRSALYSQAVAHRSTASKLTVTAMKKDKKENFKKTDYVFYENASSNAELLLVDGRSFITITYGGETDRGAGKRLKEKLDSDQLFGRHARAAAGVFINEQINDALDADGDGDDDGDDLADPDADGDDALLAKLIIAAKSEFTITNKIFTTKRFVAAAARIGGKPYGVLGRTLSDIEDDLEALIVVCTGSMIADGGTNVACLGCLPKKNQGRWLPSSRVAFRMIHDAAFTAMENSGEVDTIDEHRADVQGRLARDFFAGDSELLRQLEATALQLKYEGLSALASADAELFKKKPNAALPTVDDMDAGTFARALASAAGRKGGRVIAQRVADFRNPEITQPKKIADKTEKMLGGIGGHTDDAHKAACVAGGGCPVGGYTDPVEKKKHGLKCMASGNTVQMGRACAALEEGLKTIRTVIVHDGVEVEFFSFCEESRVSGLTCAEVYLRPCHGRLYKIMAKLPSTTTDIHLRLPMTNGTDIAGLVAHSCIKTTRKTFAKKSTIKRLEDNNITWSTAEFLVTDEMVEDFKATKSKKTKRNARSS